MRPYSRGWVWVKFAWLASSLPSGPNGPEGPGVKSERRRRRLACKAVYSEIVDGKCELRELWANPPAPAAIVNFSQRTFAKLRTLTRTWVLAGCGPYLPTTIESHTPNKRLTLTRSENCPWPTTPSQRYRELGGCRSRQKYMRSLKRFHSKATASRNALSTGPSKHALSCHALSAHMLASDS